MFGKPGSLAGKPSWNHGKTAETDERIAALGQKISESAKVAFAAGERSNVGEKNPNFGRTRDTRTPEQLENYSKAAVDRIQRGVSGIGKNRLSGVYKGEKSIGAAHFKSSWELTAMMAWDRDPTIVSYAYEPAWFKIEEGRRTLPDFLVTYADGTTCFFEIKPSHIQSMPHVKQKLDLTRVAVEITGVPYRMIGDEEIIMMQQQLGDALVAEISKHKRGCSTLPNPPVA
jgi:hypothetical protein